MILTLLMAIPIAGAVVLAVLPKPGADNGQTAKFTALLFALSTFGVALVALAKFDSDKLGLQLVENHRWMSQLGVWYSLGVDGIGLTLVLLTAVLTPIVILAAWGDRLPDPSRINAYFAWMLFLEGLAIGVFAAADVFLFYLLFEATLIPLYFLIGAHGTGTGRSMAAVKFLIYNLVGGLLMLAAIVGLYAASANVGVPDLRIGHLMTLDLSTSTERLLFLGFFIPLAVKAPMWPVHTWLPDAAAAGTTSTSVLMVSIIDKVGTFGMITWCLKLFPEASHWAAPVISVLAVISIIYGALLAVGQDDLRRLIAFTSVSHFGFIVLGIFAFTTISTAGSTLYMFNHGLSTAVLFLVVGMMISRRGSAKISDFGGIQKIAPVMSGVLLLGGLSSLSLPGMAPFVSEIMVLIGTFSRHWPLAAFATLGMVLSALYILIMYQKVMTGPVEGANAKLRDLTHLEMAALTPAIVLIVGLGFLPQTLLGIINPAVQPVIARVGVGDPPPKTPVIQLKAEGAQK